MRDYYYYKTTTSHFEFSMIPSARKYNYVLKSFDLQDYGVFYFMSVVLCVRFQSC